MTRTLISVVMPFRDAASTIDEAIRSVLPPAHLGADVELLAVDDHSQDDSADRVRRCQREDARVRLLRTDRRGLVAALDVGLAAAGGELVARMDADDRSSPERLPKQAAFLRAHPHIGAVGTRVECFADGAPVGEGLRRYVAWQNALLSPEAHRRELFVEAPLCHPSMMLRRAALAAVGGYIDDDGPEDYGLWLRLDAAGVQLAKLPEVLLWWRHHPDRATFRDPRYSLSALRRAKAPYLAARLRDAAKQRLVMWGAGPTGRRLARELESCGVRFDLWVDIDPRKLGRTARGARIEAPSALDPRTDTVVAAVGARGARELIRPDLIARGFREGADFWFAS